MFVVSLSDFDQKMFEDENQTRTADSIELFKNIASTNVFHNTPFFLVLNKFDLFQKKIKKNPDAFRLAYPDFVGDLNDIQQCIDHVKNTYHNIVPLSTYKGSIVDIIVTAIDSKSVSFLMQTLSNMIKNNTT